MTFILGEQTQVCQAVLIRMKDDSENSVGLKGTEREETKEAQGDPSMI